MHSDVARAAHGLPVAPQGDRISHGSHRNGGSCLMRRILVAGLFTLGLSSAAWAGLDSGIAAYNNGDYATAYGELRSYAEGGHPFAAYLLGRMYLAGQGVARNQTEGIKWLRRAAEEGEPDAVLQLAARYENGVGVPQSDEEAFKWYQKAANRGLGPAQLHLGIMYASGRGVAADLINAHLWLNLATASFPPGELRNSAARLRDSITARLTPAQIATAHQLARAWKPIASN